MQLNASIYQHIYTINKKQITLKKICKWAIDNNFTVLSIGFLLGRTSLFESSLPIGIAFFAAAFNCRVNRLFLAASILLGAAMTCSISKIYLIAFEILIYALTNIIFDSQSGWTIFKKSSLVLISALVPRIIICMWSGILLYDVLYSIFNSIFLATIAYTFRIAITYSTNKEATFFVKEQIINLAILMCFSACGLGNASIAGINLKTTIIMLVILVFSYSGGSSIGGAIGVSAGLIISTTSTNMPFLIGSCGFCSVLSGMLNGLGKVGTSLGFMVGSTVLSLYLDKFSDTLTLYKEMLAAISIFMLLPKNLIDNLTKSICHQKLCNNQSYYNNRIKEITVQKLNRFSSVFKELSQTFGEVPQTRSSCTDTKNMTILFDKVVDKACKNCEHYKTCWEQNFYITYQLVFKIAEEFESKGFIDNSSIPSKFLVHCKNSDHFLNSLISLYEMSKLDMVWKSKVIESKCIISQQLGEVSKALSGLAVEVNSNMCFKNDLESLILSYLDKSSLKVKQVEVVHNKSQRYSVNIFHKPCGNKKFCTTLIEQIASEAVNRRLVKESSECILDQKTGLCKLKLVEHQSLNITIGISRLPKHNQSASGDSYTFLNNKEGKYIIALSDGMGFGSRAASQSQDTINLLEQFLESGFDKDTSISLINSALLLKSNDDSFATIDLSLIDLYDGEVEFVKIGAVPTFIKKANGAVEIVKSISLPVGILNYVDTELVHKKVWAGDFIIMMTDGIIDSFKLSNQEGSFLADFISSIESKNPQEIADILVQQSNRFCNFKPIDDMTVMVAKVWENSIIRL